MLKLVVVLGLCCLGVFGANQCPPNYQLYDDGYCYRLLTAPVRKGEGQQKCQSDGATLPIIKSALQNAIVTSISSDASVVSWLGLTCSNNNNCQWDDGSSLTYSNFENNKPDVSRGSCAFVNVGNQKAGLWTSADCDSDFKAVVCQKSSAIPNQTCPNGFIKGSDGRCYYAPNIKLLFNDAQNLCTDASKNTYLVSVNSAQENSAIQLIADASGFSDIFLGLQYSVNGFEWVDGTVFNYENFEDNQPNTNIGQCVSMNVASGQWRSADCNQRMSFLCLDENTLTTPLPLTTPNPQSACPVNNSFSGPNIVQSPNFPQYYGGSIECEYHLNVAAGNVVTLRFYDFYLKNIDYIDIFEGDTDDTLLYRLQGTVSSSQWYSTQYSNTMLLRFVSKPGTANVKGWLLYFKAQAMGAVTTPPPLTTTTQPSHIYYGSGTITSPGYPNLYPNNLNATYILEAIPGSVVRITFNRILTERCCDTITLYDGRYEDSNKVIITLSGDHSSPQTFQSNGTYMTVRFLTDSVLEESGFTANFSSYNSGIPTPRTCKDGWTHDPSQQYCYKYFSNGGPWAQNLGNCNSLGAALLTVHNAQQEAFIKNFIYNAQIGSQRTLTWTGLHYQFDDWGWSDGTALTYTDWMSGEPSLVGDCAAVQAYGTYTGWKVVDCNTVLPFICYHNANTNL